MECASAIKVTDADIEVGLYRLIYDAGIRTLEGRKKRIGDRHKNMAAHTFRKFENKYLESGVDPFYVSVLMGHKAGIGVERHYYRPDSINGQYSLLELYANKAMPYLTISEEDRLKLKNRELEMRLKEDDDRFKLAFEEERKRILEGLNVDSIERISATLRALVRDNRQMKEDLAKLKKEKG